MRTPGAVFNKRNYTSLLYIGLLCQGAQETFWNIHYEAGYDFNLKLLDRH